MAVGANLLIGFGASASGVSKDAKDGSMPAHHAFEVFYVFGVDGIFVALALENAESVWGFQLSVTPPIACVF